MDLNDGVDRIVTREDLAEFLRRLAEAAASPEAEEWENSTLPRFLESLAAWAADMDGYFRNQGLEPSEQPTWRLFGRMMMAATMYE